MNSPCDESCLLKLVNIVAAKYRNHPDYDEIRQIAAVSILKQCQNCEISGKQASQTYLCKRGRSAIAEWFAQERKRQHLPLLDTDAAQEPVAELDGIDFLKKHSQRLSLDEQQLLRWRFWEGLRFEEIAQHLGCSTAWAERRVRNVIKKLRNAAGVGERGKRRRDLNKDGEGEGE